MNTNLYEILKNVDHRHRVRFTGWEIDFRNTDWPTMMEFSVKTTSVDTSTNDETTTNADTSTDDGTATSSTSFSEDTLNETGAVL